jgi:hypothetical protein
MAEPIAVIIRFNGNPDDLLERFEAARRLWIEAEGAEHPPPAFYAACRTQDGIAIVGGWETAAAHRAFGHGLGAHIEAVGLGKPDHIDRMRIRKLGWD